MQNPLLSQQPEFDLLEFDSPPPSGSSNINLSSRYTKSTHIPNLLDHDIDVRPLSASRSRPRSQLNLTPIPVPDSCLASTAAPALGSQQGQAQARKSKIKPRRSRSRLRSRSRSLSPLDIVLEESYDTKTKELDAPLAHSIEGLADEDSSLGLQEGKYLVGWVCNVDGDGHSGGSSASSSRRRPRYRASRRSLGSSSTLESLRRPYVTPLPLSQRSHLSSSSLSSSLLSIPASPELNVCDDGDSTDDASVISDLLGSSIEDETETPRTQAQYLDISIRSSLLSSSLASSTESLNPLVSEHNPTTVKESIPGTSLQLPFPQPPPYIRPTYRRSYEIPIIFSVGDEVFLLDSHGNSISWISPKKPEKDGSLLALDRHTRLMETWYRKCNVYVVAKIHVFRDPASSRDEEVYELIPDIGDDGHVRVPLVSKRELMAVRYKTGDRVRVSESENGNGGPYTGTIGLAWAEGGKRTYQVMPSGRRGFCRPEEKSIRQIECRSKRWDVLDRSRCRDVRHASFKEERDRYLTKLLRGEMAGQYAR